MSQNFGAMFHLVEEIFYNIFGNNFHDEILSEKWGQFSL